MIKQIFSIGFTQKSAEKFFSLIRDNNITLLVDVRLNNVSQLAGFSKYPDIQFFLREICNCNYLSDKNFAPEESTLKEYKSKNIDWAEYITQFNYTMTKRNLDKYIVKNYFHDMETERICFLCSENLPNFCHRRLIAERFAKLFNAEVVHLL